MPSAKTSATGSIPPCKLDNLVLSRCSLSVQGFEEVIPFEYHDGYLTIHFEVRRRKEYVARGFWILRSFMKSAARPCDPSEPRTRVTHGAATTLHDMDAFSIAITWCRPLVLP